MQRIFFCAFVYFAFAAILADSKHSLLCQGAAGLSKPRLQLFVSGLNNFAIQMYKTAAKLQQKNRIDSVFSPASIAIALGMVLEGAKGKTQTQIISALIGNASRDTLIPAEFNRLMSELNAATNQYKLITANKLYIKSDFKLSSSYESIVSKCFETTAATMNVLNPIVTANQVNSWVERQTNSKFKDLVSSDMINSDLRMLIINAVYFKAEWATPFTSQNGGSIVNNLPFTSINGQTTKKDFMFMEENFLYTIDSSVAVLGIPYQNNELYMFIFLPNKKTGFATFEASLTYQQLSALIKATQRTIVNVRIPKFTMTTDFPLKDVLTAAGMPRIFDPVLANLTGISRPVRGENLYIGEAQHQAFIAVNENGTEASAATMFGVTAETALMDPPIVFYANRPFLFAIQHASSGAILFLGSIVD